ncbi:MAG: hypothetical protein K2P76_12775 [Lachnospiraceae bacterium]|nr:hypothetical protein [Lachnospiraceae bacterium]MDE6980799.1 hypothetical protein [Lachnospiraceae bacterium]
MHILEHCLVGKENNPHTCEDGLIMGEHFITVIDGVTSKGKRLWDGKTSGCFAKEIISKYLQQDVAEQNAVELFKNLDRILYQNIRDCGEPLSWEEYPRAAIIVYNDLYKEVWSYGDCQCRINERVYTHSSKVDELNALLRAFYLEYEISQGADRKKLEQNDIGRAGIEKTLRMQFAFENRKGNFGYPVLNGMGIEESMIKTYSVAKGDVVVLASDGYPVLRESLSACETELEHIKKNDPMCFRLYRSTKGIRQGNISFDDRAFCRFII